MKPAGCGVQWPPVLHNPPDFMLTPQPALSHLKREKIVK